MDRRRTRATWQILVRTLILATTVALAGAVLPLPAAAATVLFIDPPEPRIAFEESVRLTALACPLGATRDDRRCSPARARWRVTEGRQLVDLSRDRGPFTDVTARGRDGTAQITAVAGSSTSITHVHVTEPQAETQTETRPGAGGPLVVVLPQTVQLGLGQAADFGAVLCPDDDADGIPDKGPDGVPGGGDDACVPFAGRWMASGEATGTFSAETGSNTRFTATGEGTARIIVTDGSQSGVAGVVVGGEEPPETTGGQPTLSRLPSRGVTTSLDASGNWVWDVRIEPDVDIDTSALASELGFGAITAITGDPVSGDLLALDERGALAKGRPAGSERTIFEWEPVTPAPRTELAGGDRSIALDPARGFICVVSGLGEHWRADSATGGVAREPDLAFAPEDPNEGRQPALAAIVYDPSSGVEGPILAVDAELDALVRFDPDTGAGTTLGPLGVDVTMSSGLAALPDGRLRLSTNVPGSGTTDIYEVAPATGAAIPVLTIPSDGVDLATRGGALRDEITFEALTPDGRTIRSVSVTSSFIGIGAFDPAPGSLERSTRDPASGLVYGFDADGELWRVDTAARSAAWVPIADRSFAGQFWSLYFDGSRTGLVSETGAHVAVDPASAAVTERPDAAYAADDPNAGTPPAVTAMATDPSDGTVYAVDQGAGTLATFDPLTGALRTVAVVDLAEAPIAGAGVGADGNVYLSFTLSADEGDPSVGAGGARAAVDVVRVDPRTSAFDAVVRLGPGLMPPVSPLDALPGSARGVAGPSLDLVLGADLYLLRHSSSFIPTEEMFGAGAITSVASGPDTGTHYVSTQGGGVWRTVDAGRTWTQLADVPDLAGRDPSLLLEPGSGVLRAVDAGGLNIRVNLISGNAERDPDLRYAADDPNASRTPAIAAITLDPEAPAGPGLLGLDADLGTLTRVDPITGDVRTVAPLGIDLAGQAGLAATRDGRLFVSLNAPGSGVTDLYRFSPATGGADRVFSFFFDASDVGVGSATAGDTLHFDFLTPGGIYRTEVSAASTPLADFRPSPGDLTTIVGDPISGDVFGLNDQGDLWQLHPAEKTAERVPVGEAPFGQDRWFGYGDGRSVGFVADSGTHFVIDVPTGSMRDRPSLAYAPDDTNAGAQPSIAALATDPTDGTMYAIDTGVGAIATLDPASGTLRTAGPLGSAFAGPINAAVDAQGQLIVAVRPDLTDTGGAAPIVDIGVMDVTEGLVNAAIRFWEVSAEAPPVRAPDSHATAVGTGTTSLPRVTSAGIVDEAWQDIGIGSDWWVLQDPGDDLVAPATGGQASPGDPDGDITSVHIISDKRVDPNEDPWDLIEWGGDPPPQGDYLVGIVETAEPPPSGPTDEDIRVVTFATPGADPGSNQAGILSTFDLFRGTDYLAEFGFYPGMAAEVLTRYSGEPREDTGEKRGNAVPDFAWGIGPGGYLFLMPADQVGDWFVVALLSGSTRTGLMADIVPGPGPGSPGIPADGRVDRQPQCVKVEVEGGEGGGGGEESEGRELSLTLSGVPDDLDASAGLTLTETRQVGRGRRARDRERELGSPQVTRDGEGWKLSWPIGTRPARYSIDAQPSSLWAEVVRQTRATMFSLAASDTGVLAGAPACGTADDAPPAALPGDFNADGSVDAADYVVWRKRGGTADEYDDWRANFGQQR